MSRELVSPRDASSHRGWATERFVRRLIAERRIAFHHVGRRVYVDLADLDEFAERGRVEPPAPRLVVTRQAVR